MILAMFLASTLSASAQHRMSIEEMFKLIDKNNTSIQAGKTFVDAAQEGSKEPTTARHQCPTQCKLHRQCLNDRP